MKIQKINMKLEKINYWEPEGKTNSNFRGLTALTAWPGLQFACRAA
jgi:hypothetical protein